MSYYYSKRANESFVSNSTLFRNQFSTILFDLEVWLTISLSSISSLSLLTITIIYIITQIRSRDRVKESRKLILKKLVKNEYLVFSYCLSLFFSHILSVSHKLITKFFVEGIVRIEFLCLIIGILKHYFWLSSLFHSNAVSVKIYLKLSKSLNDNLNDKKNWTKSALQIFAYIYGATILIVVCSILIHFNVKTNSVYELKHSDKINSCFLSQPLFLIVFFAFPVLVILSINATLFIIVFLKTKTTIHHSDNNEMNNLFLKLATIMGLSWVIYVLGVVIIEIFTSHILAQIIVLITSCQINLQGFVVVLGLYSNAVYDLMFKKKTSKNTGPAGNRANRPNQNRVNYHQRITVL